MTFGFAEQAPAALAVGDASVCEGPVRPPSRERMKQWITAAQAGAKIALGSGPSQRQALGGELFDLVTSLHGLGYLTPHTTRHPVTRELVYIAVRSAQPLFRSTRL